MRLLGIDVGSKNLGISIVSYTATGPWLVLQETLVLTNPKIELRLVEIFEKIKYLIDEYDIDLIAYEAPYMNRGKNAMGLYYVCGVIQLVAGIFDKGIMALSPKTVKKEVTGTGNAEKKLVETKVIEYLQPATTSVITFSSDHASDAAAVCIAAYKKDE